jgi:hypothetical protein
VRPRRAIFGLAIAGAAACGLAVSGTGSAPEGSDASAAPDAARDLGSSDTQGSDSGAARPDAPNAVEASPDGAPDASCVRLPTDASIPTGALDLTSFQLRGNAAYNQSGDGKITLTDSQNFQKGAAWYSALLPVVSSYKLTFVLRVGPNDTAGDGITYAVLAATSTPGVGDDGDGIGLRNISGSAVGYAVVVDMYKNLTDPTDDDVTTLKVLTMPGFVVVAHQGLAEKLDDGNLHEVDVTFAQGTLSAVLHGPTLTSTVTGIAPGFSQVLPAYVGFTGATGGGSNAHQEIASATLTAACE